MRPSERAAQARRELDRTFAAAELEPIRTPPRSGWIRAIRGALGMSQAVLAERLGVSAAAVNKLEHAEVHGGITTAKLAEVAAALDCTLVYALVPRSKLEQAVLTHARAMALEAQEIEGDRQREAVDRYTQELVAKGSIWRAAPGRRRRETLVATH